MTIVPGVAASASRRPATGRLRRFFSSPAPFIVAFLTPSLLGISLFVFYPSLYAIYLSFTNASLIRLEWSFVGLANFVTFFRDSEGLNALRNTYVYVSIVIVFQFLLGLVFALVLNSVKRGRGVYGALLFLPWVFSDILAVASWKWIFNDTYGLLNYYLMRLGFDEVKWLATPRLAMFVVILLNIWKGYPFSMVLELSGLQTIPPDLYEAARVDGASRWQLFTLITLPLMRFIMLANIILITVYTFNIFSLVYATTGGGPVNATEIIGLFMYRAAFISGRLGFGSAVAVIMFLANVLITIIYLRTLGRQGTTVEY